VGQFLRAVASVAVFASVVLSWPTGARAFCRTTTCEPARETCARDSDGCLVDGLALRWPKRCIEIGLDLQSAVAAGFDPAQIHARVDAARVRWTGAECEGGVRPGLCLSLEVACGPVDASIRVHFAPETTGSASSLALAQSEVQFAPDGTIEHVQIEIFPGDQPLTVRDDDVGYDLMATVIHELGHAIGLDHSAEPDAAMYAQPRYQELTGRSLGSDDRAAVCAVYPPGELAEPAPGADPEPTPAPLEECAAAAGAGAGCATAGGPAEAPLLAWLAVLALSVRRRRRQLVGAVSGRRGETCPAGTHERRTTAPWDR
jgi:MYXO-CTERM domain-containing protein